MWYNIIIELINNEWYLLVNPGSSSENIKKPLFISSVRGANSLEVAVWGLGKAGGELETGENTLEVTVSLRGKAPGTVMFSMSTGTVSWTASGDSTT